MSGRILLWLLATFFLTTNSTAEAQQATKVPRLGYLASRPDSRDDGFRQGLRDLGYVEGKNIFIDYRFVESGADRLPDVAAELVRLRAGVLVTVGTAQTRAAKQATATIPIVMIGIGDPVESGLVKSLARPGGNITGSSALSPELSGKRLELLKEAFPQISRIAILWNPDNQVAALSLKETEVVGQALGLKLLSLQYRNLNDLNKALSVIAGGNVDALIFLRGLAGISPTRIAEWVAKTRLPAMYPFAEFADTGGLMAYGISLIDLHRRAATYVDKILKGAKPADLPVEQPTKFEFIINLKAAKQIGLTIPPNVLARADRVIK
jgi:putative tryptophan/tyrosine transport system substrate-binding protein